MCGNNLFASDPKPEGRPSKLLSLAAVIIFVVAVWAVVVVENRTHRVCGPISDMVVVTFYTVDDPTKAWQMLADSVHYASETDSLIQFVAYHGTDSTIFSDKQYDAVFTRPLAGK